MSGWKLWLVIALPLAGCAGEAKKDEARARPATRSGSPAEPSKSAPASEPEKAAKPEPAKPEPANPQPAKPEPAKPAPAKPEPAKPEGSKAGTTKPGAPTPAGSKPEGPPAPQSEPTAAPARPKTDEELLAEVEAKMGIEDVGDPRTLGGKPIRGPETDADRIERLKRQALILDEVAIDPSAAAGKPQRTRSRISRDRGQHQPLVERLNRAIDAGRWGDYAACFTPGAQRAMAAEIVLLLCVAAGLFETRDQGADAQSLWTLVASYGVDRRLAQQLGRGLQSAPRGATDAWVGAFRTVHDALSDPRRTLVDMYAAMATQEDVELFLLLDGPLVAGRGNLATARSRGRPPMEVRVTGQVIDFDGPTYCANMLAMLEAKAAEDGR